MGKRGSISVNMIVAGILATFILIIVFAFVSEQFGDYIGIAKLFPGFVRDVPAGTSTVGINLETGNLAYFTRERWRVIKDSDTVFKLDKYEFVPNKLKSDLNNFYFDTQRRPGALSMEINHWRYIDASMKGKSVAFNTNTKSGLIGPDLEEQYIINNKDEIQFTDSRALILGANFPHFNKFEITDSVKNGLIKWRDSILQGNECEKFLTLPLKENKKYTVRITEGYLFVDLNLPVTTDVEKWTDEDCFKFKNYIDSQKDYTQIPIQINFVDSFLDNKPLTFTFDSEVGWTLPDSRYLSGIWGFRTEKYRYGISGARIKSFLNGVYDIFSTGAGEIHSLKVVADNSGKQTALYQKESFTKEDLNNLDRIAYEILSRYNQALIDSKAGIS